MDKLSRYQEIIKKHLAKIQELCNRRPQPGVETLSAFDDERGAYLLLVTGWTREHRVRGATLFVRLKNGKIWVEEDWTEDGIVPELIKAGVPKDDVVLAFHAPEKREYTEFAVA